MVFIQFKFRAAGIQTCRVTCTNGTPLNCCQLTVRCCSCCCQVMFSRSFSRSSILCKTSNMTGVGLDNDSACFRSSRTRCCRANGLSSSASDCRDAFKLIFINTGLIRLAEWVFNYLLFLRNSINSKKLPLLISKILPLRLLPHIVQTTVIPLAFFTVIQFFLFFRNLINSKKLYLNLFQKLRHLHYNTLCFQHLL